MTTFFPVLRELYDQRPQDVAIYMVQAGQPDYPLTYEELIHRAAGYAKVLEHNEVETNQVVVLVFQHGIDLITSFFGAVLHGAIPAIMPFLTEKLHPEQYRANLTALISVTKPASIITYPEFKAEAQSAVSVESSVKAVISTDQVVPETSIDWNQLGGMQCSPDDIVLLQHSSGTTGLQKGVALSHRAVFNQLHSYADSIQLRSSDVIVSWLPLYHDMGLVASFVMPILKGISLVLMSPFDWVRAPYRLLQLVSQYKGTLTWLPNFAYNFCAQKVREHQLEGVDLSSWRAVINCSEPMRWESHQAFLERFSAYGFNSAALTTCYAMAENVFAVTQGGIGAPVNVDEIDLETLRKESVAQQATVGNLSIKMLSAGPPIANVKVKILNAQGENLPDRHIGEIAIQSDCMLTEYYHRPDVTAKSFLDGWYLTGDYGYLVDGELYITGRKKDLIIIGGKNIYPQDLEALAMEVSGVHPGRVVVFGVFNEEKGTEEAVIVAEIEASVLERKKEITKAIWQRVAQGSAVVPGRVHLVERGWLIKTSSGKIARSANRDKYLTEVL